MNSLVSLGQPGKEKKEEIQDLPKAIQKERKIKISTNITWKI